MTRYFTDRNTLQREKERGVENKERDAEKIAQGHAQLLARVSEIELKMGVLGQAVLPISTAFQQMLVKELTHFHTPEMDELMTRIGPPSELSEEEEARLVVLLAQRAEDMGDEITDSEREAAVILPIIMHRAKEEANALKGSLVQFKLVTVPPESETETKKKESDPGAADEKVG